MILEKIIKDIQTGIQDDSFTVEGHIMPLINEALDLVAYDFCHAGLASTAVINIAAGDTGPAPLPEDYHHDVYRVENETFKRPVFVRSNIDVLAKLYDELESTGPIDDVAAEGDQLYFEPYPTTTDQRLKVYYYRKPVEYESIDTDETPEWLPASFHKSLIVDYALKELWALVEDGIDGQKINTSFYNSTYLMGLGRLTRDTRRNPKQNPAIKRTARFF